MAAPSLREQLLNRPDAKQRDYVLKSMEASNGSAPVTVTIRRFTIGEREELIKEYKLGASGQSQEEQRASSVAIVARGIVPSLTVEEVRELPAAVVDEVAQHLLDFNGWTERGKAELSDQFRPSA